MSGHSKWSKVKHQKAVTDVVRGKIFTKAAAAIALAVREGGGVADPAANFKLRLAIDKAKAANVPRENIERAIEKGKGSTGDGLSAITYEAYGPGGTGIIIETVTDNKQRTVSQLKNVLEHHAGTLATPGAVMYLFDRRGILTVQSERSLDDILVAAIAAGADDVSQVGEGEFQLLSAPESLSKIKQAFSQQQVHTDIQTEIGYSARITVALADEHGQRLGMLIDSIEELDDVHHVYTNAV